MKPYFVRDIARIVNCGPSTAFRMMKSGAYGKVRLEGKFQSVEVVDDETVFAIGHRLLKGRHGYKRAEGRKPFVNRPIALERREVIKTAEVKTPLMQLVELASIPEEKRELLLKVGEKFSIAELRLILTL